MTSTSPLPTLSSPFSIVSNTVLGSVTADFLNPIDRPIKNGTSGNDRLYASTAGEVIASLGGNDTIIAGKNADTIDGGEGNDLISYETSTSAVTVDLTTGRGKGGAAEGDMLSNIENVTGSSFNDILTGGSGNNSLFGGNGNDTFIASGGYDTYNGGEGIDTVDFSTQMTGTAVNLLMGSSGSMDAQSNKYVSIENIIGSSASDTIFGSNAANNLAGGAGNDILNGGAGHDTLVGGAGNDTIDGGTGIDTAVYSGNRADYTITALNGGFAIQHNSVTITSTDVQGIFPAIDGTDFVTNVENFQFKDGTLGLVDLLAPVGTVNNDTLMGTKFADILNGLDGNDFINGGAGNDTLTGGAGNDSLDGGDGTDTAVFTGNRDAYTITQNNGGYYIQHNETFTQQGDALYVNKAVDGNDFVKNIENFSFNGTIITAADLFKPTTGNDILKGTTGNDTLDGLAGNDTISGGAGNDSLIGNTGNDNLDGGAGNDTLVSDLSIDNMIYYDVAPVGGIALMQTAANVLTGGSGNDIFVFAANTMLLHDDTITDFTIGQDKISLTSNLAANFTDVMNHASQAGANTVLKLLNETITLNNVDMAKLTAADFGMTSTATTGNDYLAGTSRADTIDGQAGNDTLIGGAGNDVLIGGTGADVLNGGEGVDTVSYSTATSAVYASLAPSTSSFGDAVGDSYVSIENLTGSAFDDRLSGDANNNSLDGGAGNDVIYGSAGADILNGGAGNDTADYSLSTSGITVNLMYGYGAGGDAQNDKLISIENVTGSGFNDYISGDATNNNLIGLDGHDTLNGGNGNDTVDGGNGNDNLMGEAGNDSLLGNSGNDTINGGSGDDTIVADLEFDSFSFGGAMPYPGSERPAIMQTTSANVLTGGEGNDTFIFHHSDSNTAFDSITDFGKGDVLELSGQFATSLTEVMAHATQSGANTVLTFDHEIITLNNVQVKSLTAANFVFDPVYYPA